jgi:hypothetical protein
VFRLEIRRRPDHGDGFPIVGHDAAFAFGGVADKCRQMRFGLADTYGLHQLAPRIDVIVLGSSGPEQEFCAAALALHRRSGATSRCALEGVTTPQGRQSLAMVPSFIPKWWKNGAPDRRPTLQLSQSHSLSSGA